MTRNIANVRRFAPLAVLSSVVASVSCGGAPANDALVSSTTATTAVPRREAVSQQTGICAPDELQCGTNCIVSDPSEMMDALCLDGTVFPWCFSDYEGPFYACPVGAVEGGGTRYACTYVNSDPLNCGQCGVICPEGKTCSSGSCW
jgi:hypothetical protein